MKYQRLDSFLADYKRLSAQEQALFLAAVRQMNEAYARRGDQPLLLRPASLRIRAVRGAPGIWELTWPSAGPAGWATFDYVTSAGERALRWRRGSGRRIVQQP